MKNRTCSRCHDRPARKSGYYCDYCHNEYQKKYYKEHPRSTDESARRRLLAIRSLIIEAKNVPCMDCHNRYPYYVMEFDHVRGQKLFNLSVAANKRLPILKVKEEISKCDPVCANCHRERTFARLGVGATVAFSALNRAI